jgi:hypothetical protein
MVGLISIIRTNNHNYLVHETSFRTIFKILEYIFFICLLVIPNNFFPIKRVYHISAFLNEKNTNNWSMWIHGRNLIIPFVFWPGQGQI